MTILRLLTLLTPATSLPPPALTLPPPIVAVGTDYVPAVASFEAGEARCNRGAEAFVRSEPPLPQVTTVASATTGPDPVTLRFRIDSGGRPLSIVEESRSHSSGSPYVGSRDLAAALAASRFRPGPERSGCTIDYEVTVKPVAEAELGTVYRVMALQPAPALGARRALFDRTVPPGSNCFTDPRLNVRLRAYPAFEEIPQAPGTLSFSFVGFDLDSTGQPRNVRLLASGGNAELDRQSLDAVRRSRYSPRAKTGCTYSYWRRQTDPLRPPPSPDPDSYRPAGASCPAEGLPWASMPALTFPPEFERRGIEGWALVRFDVAPWGGVGNVAVLAAEPAAAFGLQAARIVGGARKPPSARGYTGCVARVQFRLPSAGAIPAVSDP